MVGRSHDFKAQMIRYSKLLNFCTYTVWTPAKRFSASGPRPKIKSRLPRVNCLRATRPNIDSYVLKQKHFGFRAFQCSRIAAPFPPLPRCAFGASEYAGFFLPCLDWIIFHNENNIGWFFLGVFINIVSHAFRILLTFLCFSPLLLSPGRHEKSCIGQEKMLIKRTQNWNVYQPFTQLVCRTVVASLFPKKRKLGRKGWHWTAKTIKFSSWFRISLLCLLFWKRKSGKESLRCKPTSLLFSRFSDGIFPPS